LAKKPNEIFVFVFNSAQFGQSFFIAVGGLSNSLYSKWKMFFIFLLPIVLLMKNCIALLFLTCCALIVSAQNNLPPVFEITTDTALYDTLPNTYWQKLEDKDGKLSFDEVNKNQQDKEQD
jgi:hypothetical protein